MADLTQAARQAAGPLRDNLLKNCVRDCLGPGWTRHGRRGDSCEVTGAPLRARGGPVTGIRCPLGTVLFDPSAAAVRAGRRGLAGEVCGDLDTANRDEALGPAELLDPPADLGAVMVPTLSLGAVSLDPRAVDVSAVPDRRQREHEQ